MVAAIADQVGPAHGLERLTQQRPVVGVVVAQKGLVQASAPLTAHDVHGLAVAPDLAQRVLVAVVHGRGGGHRAGVKGLHLVSAKAIFLEPQRQVHHVFVAGAWVGSNEVRNQVLLLACFQAELVKQGFELVVAADTRLHHLGQGPGLGVFGGNLQVAAHMVRDQLLDVLGALHCQVVAQARADQDFFDAPECATATVHLDQRRVVGAQVGADTGVNAARLAAGRLDLGAAATQPVHVGGGATQVGNGAGEALHLVANVLDLADHRVFRTALDDAPLVLGD